MSLPINRDSVESIMRDMLNRIRALEAKRSSTGNGFGESVELEVVNQVITGTETLEWTEVYDPHAFFAGGTSNTFVTVPAGLAGAYHISLVFETGGE